MSNGGGLPKTATERKTYPVASGVLDYFPDAIAEVAHVSYAGNEQHNPGTPLHWDRAKSGDEADALMRHLIQRGTFDVDGIRHTAKVAWRALALLQKELEVQGQPPIPPPPPPVEHVEPVRDGRDLAAGRIAVPASYARGEYPEGSERHTEGVEGPHLRAVRIAHELATSPAYVKKIREEVAKEAAAREYQRVLEEK